MITSTMTAQEIVDKTIFRDRDRIEAYVIHRVKELRKVLRKAKGMFNNQML